MPFGPTMSHRTGGSNLPRSVYRRRFSTLYCTADSACPRCRNSGAIDSQPFSILGYRQGGCQSADICFQSGPVRASRYFMRRASAEPEHAQGVEDDSMIIRKTPATGLRTTYCPHCQLATRIDRDRCLHCGRPVSQARRIPDGVVEAEAPGIGPTCQ